ncbi:hypothetical protein ACO0SA_001125 [Hanseniaspora valbyensis]
MITKSRNILLSVSFLSILFITHFTFKRNDNKQTTIYNSFFKILKDDHNIDIDSLDRSPTLTPDRSKRLAEYDPNDSDESPYKNPFIISTDLEQCNDIIKELVQEYSGINYADIAVNIGLCIGMINFFNSGIGGGGYATLYEEVSSSSSSSSSPSSSSYFYDFRETAPEAWNNSIHNLTKIGGLSIATPGELKGFAILHERHGSGTISFKNLIKPIVKLGRDGFVIGEVLGATLDKYVEILELLDEVDDIIFNLEDWRFLYSDFDNRISLTKGDIMFRKEFADTLEYIGDVGVDEAFYNKDSKLVTKMVDFIQRHGGILSVDDFHNYNVAIGKPLIHNLGERFENKKIITSAGSSSGFSLVSALKIMEQCGSSYIGGDMMPDTSFQMIEAMKWMGSARTRLGDYYYNINSTDTVSAIDTYPKRIEDIINSQSWVDRACGYMKKERKTLANVMDYDPKFTHSEAHGTAHYSVVDDKGNAISVTTTINLLFGSLLHDPVTGMIFNNEMDDFSSPYEEPNSFGLRPSKYNIPEPNKRPLSSMVPTIIIDELGRVELVIGASGGSRITTSVFQAIIRILFYKMPLLETISYPRLHHQLMPDILEVESIKMIGSDLINEFNNSMQYDVIENVGKAVINAIHRTDRNVWQGVADYWRKRGKADIIVPKD